MTIQAAALNWEELLDTSKTGYSQGNCYENCARFVMSKGKPDGEFEGSLLLLCHGDVRGRDGIYHGHAWIEWGDGIPLVFDPSSGHDQVMVAASSNYYQLAGIDPDAVRRYRVVDVRKQIVAHKYYGPWEDG